MSETVRYEKQDRKARGQHIDWMFLSERVAIAVEIKVKDVPIFQLEQLRRYRMALIKHPQLQVRPYKGLIFLGRECPGDRRLGRRATRDVLAGVVLWRDVAGELQALAPDDPTDRMLWETLLSHAIGSAAAGGAAAGA
ncbi:hypothetical protein AYO39_01005 [Actinobacteria bacterium SCGC AG-212-D09]|nr:hypothetical protein AYO39_01005 [Actinobacteria bacterium SCGC AG-212-D09]